MEDGENCQKSKKRRNRWIVIGVVTFIVMVVVVALVLGLSLQKTTEQEEFKHVFTTRCKAFKHYDCQKIWTAFEQAYVGKDPCAVPPEAYRALVEAAPFTPACNRMMFWSQTKDLVNDYTTKRDCHFALESTLLGAVMNNLMWCGKEGSKETFTTGCPGWSDCVNNPVRSFWNQASAGFAKVACGAVAAMLNGSLVTPYSPTSMFASVEVKLFNPAIMKSLKVVLVTQKKEVSNCTNASFKDLQKDLAQGIAYSCQEVPESQIQKCASQPEIPCESCW